MPRRACGWCCARLTSRCFPGGYHPGSTPGGSSVSCASRRGPAIEPVAPARAAGSSLLLADPSPWELRDESPGDGAQARLVRTTDEARRAEEAARVAHRDLATDDPIPQDVVREPHRRVQRAAVHARTISTRIDGESAHVTPEVFLSPPVPEDGGEQVPEIGAGPAA